MLSGIGPANTLESLKIPLVSELRGVGQNLWVSKLLMLNHATPILSHYLGSTVLWDNLQSQCHDTVAFIQ